MKLANHILEDTVATCLLQRKFAFIIKKKNYFYIYFFKSAKLLFHLKKFIVSDELVMMMNF